MIPESLFMFYFESRLRLSSQTLRKEVDSKLNEKQPIREKENSTVVIRLYKNTFGLGKYVLAFEWYRPWHFPATVNADLSSVKFVFSWAKKTKKKQSKRKQYWNNFFGDIFPSLTFNSSAMPFHMPSDISFIFSLLICLKLQTV